MVFHERLSFKYLQTFVVGNIFVVS